MGSFYRILILCDPNKKIQIDDILGKSTGDPKIGWSLIIDEDSPKFSNALEFFIDLIINNLDRLNEIGISIDRITFWYLYEYEQECNMAFYPGITKRLGDLGVTLCISCWQK